METFVGLDVSLNATIVCVPNHRGTLVFEGSGVQAHGGTAITEQCATLHRSVAVPEPMITRCAYRPRREP